MSFVIDRDGHRRVVADYYSRAKACRPDWRSVNRCLQVSRSSCASAAGCRQGLQKRLYPVPQPLLGRLPAAPPYFTRATSSGATSLMLDRRTDTVVAVIHDALPR